MNNSHQPPYEDIHTKLSEGKIIPFLGSEASSFPGMQELIKELTNYLDRQNGYPTNGEVDLPRIAQYIEDLFGRGGMEDLLIRIIKQDKYQPTLLHRYLAQLPANLLIVTTNYDTLLEKAFAEINRPLNKVYYDINNLEIQYKTHDSNDYDTVYPNDFDINLEDATTVFKLHGSIFAENPAKNSLLITEDDYVELFSRMGAQTAIPAQFLKEFKENHFLFLGFGLQDWHMRVILHTIRRDWRQSKKFNSWAIQHKTTRIEQEFWDKRQLLRIYEMTINEFLKKLIDFGSKNGNGSDED